MISLQVSLYVRRKYLYLTVVHLLSLTDMSTVAFRDFVSLLFHRINTVVKYCVACSDMGLAVT